MSETKGRTYTSSQLIDAYVRGKRAGSKLILEAHRDGYSTGYKKAYNNGYDNGWEDGYDDRGCEIERI